MATTTFYSQIAANRRNSVLLSIVVIVLLAALAGTIGIAATASPRAGAVIAAVAVGIGFLASLITFYAGDALVLASSGAHEVSEQDAPQLHNVVREIAIAAN